MVVLEMTGKMNLMKTQHWCRSSSKKIEEEEEEEEEEDEDLQEGQLT